MVDTISHIPRITKIEHPVIPLLDHDGMIEALHNDLVEVISDRINGTQIALASVIGVLEVIKYDMLQDIRENNYDED